MKPIYLLLTVALAATNLFAFDFTAPDTNGNTIYYNIVGGDSVEVTKDDTLAYSYVGAVMIPDTVRYDTTLYRVTGITKGAFMNCTKLTSIQWGENMTQIQDSAFYGCTTLKDVTWTNNLQHIGTCCFQGSKIEQVYLPASLVYVTSSAFFKCTKLMRVDVDPDNQKYCSIDGVLFSKDQKLLYYFPSGRGGEYHVPEGVIRIGGNAFNQASLIEKVVLPNSVDTINGWAFTNCAMKAIDLGKEMHHIGEYALNTCKNLTYLNIPHGISVLPKSSVSGCPNLKRVVFPSTLDTIVGGMFWGCTKIDTMICLAVKPPRATESHIFYMMSPSTVVQVPMESIKKYKSTLFWKDFSLMGLTFATDITSSSAVIKWMPEVEVDQYTISVYTSDTLFRQYHVDGDGNLIEPQNAPHHIHPIKKDTTYSTDEFYVLTMDGLDEATDYVYTITGTNSAQQQVYHEEGSFRTTENSEGFLDTFADDPDKPRKTLRNGQIYILRREKIYTLTGQEVR